MLKKVRENFNFLKFRHRTVNQAVKRLFYGSALSIIIIEFFFKRWAAPNDVIYRVCDFFLKLFYSFTASTIFFFVNQHLPKEAKRLKTISIVNGQLSIIASEISLMLSAIGITYEQIGKREITFNLINSISANKEAGDVCAVFESNIKFNSWNEYFKFKGERLELHLKTMMTIHELVDNDILQELFHLTSPIEVLKDNPMPIIKVEGYSKYGMAIFECYVVFRDLGNLFEKKMQPWFDEVKL